MGVKHLIAKLLEPRYGVSTYRIGRQEPEKRGRDGRRAREEV
jgi:hypothetical protein